MHARSVTRERSPFPSFLLPRFNPFVKFTLAALWWSSHEGTYPTSPQDVLLPGTQWLAWLRKLKARAIAAFIFEEIICRWGNVDTISTDNGSEFDNVTKTKT